jgi:hypothetical protein
MEAKTRGRKPMSDEEKRVAKEIARKKVFSNEPHFLANASEEEKGQYFSCDDLGKLQMLRKFKKVNKLQIINESPFDSLVSLINTLSKQIKKDVDLLDNLQIDNLKSKIAESGKLIDSVIMLKLQEKREKLQRELEEIERKLSK